MKASEVLECLSNLMGNLGRPLKVKNMNNNADNERQVDGISGGNNRSTGNWNKGPLMLCSGSEFASILPTF